MQLIMQKPLKNPFSFLKASDLAICRQDSAWHGEATPVSLTVLLTMYLQNLSILPHVIPMESHNSCFKILHICVVNHIGGFSWGILWCRWQCEVWPPDGFHYYNACMERAWVRPLDARRAQQCKGSCSLGLWLSPQSSHCNPEHSLCSGV